MLLLLLLLLKIWFKTMIYKNEIQIHQLYLKIIKLLVI